VTDKIGALIVSGYLGSGKTTLVGHLLKEAQATGIRLAIISNEFGDTGIDKALLEAGEDGFVELDGGCVCCRLSDALGETIEAILTQIQPDRLVLETSGVALPGDILIQFWRPPIDRFIAEEVVVVLVDAEHIATTDDLEETFIDQLGSADMVLLNKCDLVDDEGLRLATERIEELSGGQPILRSVQARVNPDLLFPPDPAGVREARRDREAVRSPHVHEQFTTLELAFSGVVDPKEVLATIAAQDAVRAKGFIQTQDGIRVVQGVGPRIEITDPEREIDPELIGKVVIIHRTDERHSHE